MSMNTRGVSVAASPRINLNDRFELKAQAGVGGMGTVYQAIDRRTGALCAVKILKLKSISDVGRFDQEAALLKELHHPGIVRYVDHGVTSQGFPYIAMEWLEGETLERRLTRGPLPQAAVAHLAARLLQALAAAHERGVVHRDIKPSNIFLSGWRIFDVRLLDFGIARRLLNPKRFTRVGSIVGTPLYSAPEQARGDAEIDGRADLFSLGCVLFECLSGRPPFTGATAQDVMRQVCLGSAPELASECPGLDPELRRRVQRMLAREPDERPPDAEILAHEMRGIAARLGAAEDRGGVLEEAPRAPENVSFGEQRVLCGLMLSFATATTSARRTALAPQPKGQGARDSSKATKPESTGASVELAKAPNEARATEIRQLAEAAGATAEWLDRGTFILTPMAAGAVVDQALDMARLALTIATQHPDWRFSLGLGRATLLAGIPRGSLIDRLSDLLPEQVGVIAIDHALGRLLPAHLVMRGPRGPTLQGHEDDETPAARDPLAIPFVGRDREMDDLLAMLEESREEEVARAVLMIGGPGTGKTRLGRELVARVRTAGHPTRTFLLRGQKDWASEPHRLLAPLFAEAAIPVGGAGTNPAAAEAALLKWLAALCGETPVLIACDDLQWADRQSLMFLDAALRQMGHQPLVVLGFGRPELETQMPGLWKERSPERRRLSPLSRRAGNELFQALAPNAPPAAAGFALERWEGNPFFMSEMARAGNPQLPRVPETVLGTIEARFAMLDEEPRRLLRAASLYGDTFFPEGLVALLGEKSRPGLEDCLAVLLERDFFRREGLEADAGYCFRNPLLRESAFAMLTPADRALGRQRARAWLESEGKTLPEFLLASSLAVTTQTGNRAVADTLK